MIPIGKPLDGTVFELRESETGNSELYIGEL